MKANKTLKVLRSLKWPAVLFFGLLATNSFTYGQSTAPQEDLSGPPAPLSLRSNILTSVDLRDLAVFDGPIKEETKLLLSSIQKDLELHFPKGVRFLLEGESGKNLERSFRKNTVYGIEYIQAPTVTPDNDLNLHFRALYHSDATGLMFRYFSAQVSRDPLAIKWIKIEDKEIPLSSTNLNIRVSLVQRKVFVEDQNLEIKKVYPLAVGGFDEGITAGSRGATRLMTRILDEALLLENLIQPARNNPSYYKRRPFIQIALPSGIQTPFAFHIFTDNKFERGFLSHGCMRLRDKDLYELYALLANHPNGKIKVNIALLQPDLEEHPFPLLEKAFQTVKNFGTPTKPLAKKDDHKLTIMIMKSGVPPYEKLLPPGTVVMVPIY